MKTTIFRQLIVNVIIPVVIALLVLGGLNYVNTKFLLEESNEKENIMISSEIYNYLSLQEVALEALETNLNERMQQYSEVLVNVYLKNTDNVESLNLREIGNEIGLDPMSEDIYIINENGIVVNTTFPQDLHLDFFKFGEEHKNLLLNILKNGKFVSERFAIENTTQRIKKYTYQPTLDGKFIVELGMYSKLADGVNLRVKSTIDNISVAHESVVDVALFIGQDQPFSLNKKEKLNQEQSDLIKRLLVTKNDTSITAIVDGNTLYYDYLYMERKHTALYKSAIVQIVSDRSDQKSFLWQELIKLLLIFIITICVVIFLIYKNTKIITGPIKRLVENVTRISRGNFNERALVEGNNEVTKLSEHFNMMLETIEEYYNELEQKVEERTQEVVQQKEEIEAQRDSLAQKNIHIREAYVQIETQNKHITDSIHYAQRLQRAILPPMKYVKDAIPNSFVLFKPKDIVSGDFYWAKIDKGVSLIAAVDCTGHGVPGAFMSILASEQLNNVVNFSEDITPNVILNTLNERITNALNQTDSKDKVKDGMDLSMCSIDYNKKILLFAGANNPIYFFRNGELVVYKGDKFPIGAYVGEKLQEFTSVEIKLQEGDTFYMFSDGYADQFGGPSNKKYMYKRLKEYLTSIQHKTMDEQKTLLDREFELWKGDEIQVDDVLIIGVRI